MEHPQRVIGLLNVACREQNWLTAINSVVVCILAIAPIWKANRAIEQLAVLFTVMGARADVHPIISHAIVPQHWRPIVGTASAIHWRGTLAVRTDFAECAELLSFVGTYLLGRSPRFSVRTVSDWWW